MVKDFTEKSTAGRNAKNENAKSSEIEELKTRSHGATQTVTAVVALALMAPSVGSAATLPDGYVMVSAEMGVASARRLADGTLELTLLDGSVQIVGPDDFVVLEGGAFALTAGAAEAIAALSEPMQIDGVAGGAAAGLLGVVAAASGDGKEPEAPATVGGVTTGSVTEDAGLTAGNLTVSGALTVTDPNEGQAVFVAQASAAGTNGYGTFTLGTNGAWTYAADNTQADIQALGAGATLSDSFTAVTADGTTQVVTVTITGVNDGAVIAGATTGGVTEDAGASLTTSGTLTVTDVDSGEDVFVAQASAAGTNGYGTFTLGTNGAWTYAADNTQADIQALGAGETLTDSFTAVTADGTTQLVTVTITGLNDVFKVELSDIEAGTGGFVINGVSTYDRSGSSVSSAGDVNGDGFDDLIIGASRDDPNGSYSGASFVVFGKTDGTAVELSDIENGIGGFVINGVSVNDFSGSSVSYAGDVNGDGFDDLIIGAYGDDPNGGDSGASFVVFGKTDGTAVELSDLEAGNGGFVINGVSAGDRSGVSVSTAGDVNGDGLDDLIVGALRDDPNGSNSGASFVVFGKTNGTAVELSDIENGTGGFVINGVSANDVSGRSVSTAGDVNGDGFDDLIVGAPFDYPNGDYSGASFVVFGKTDGTAVELSAVEAGTGGFVINGVSANDSSGLSVSSTGDVNGDGFDDLIVGAYGDDPNGDYSGASFVVFGKTDGTAVELSAVEAGNGGFVINGVSASDRSGRSVSSAGDVNGDGFDDLIVGADGDDPNDSSSGASFVVFGGNFTGAATEIGTVGDDILIGTSFDDVIFAGTGNDTLDGGGGTDRLSGGAGADIFTLRNLDGTTTVIDFDGGEGDKLVVSDFGLADFTAFQSLLSAEGPGGHDTRITFDVDTVMILEDIRPDDLVAVHVIL